LVFYFLKPVSEHASRDAFTIWLQSNLKSGKNTSVLSEIKSLHSVNGEMESIIREASALVKAHADDFKLPVDTRSKDENEVFQLLLKEWNDYQNSSSGMGKAVIIKQAQPQTILPASGMAMGGKWIAHQQKPKQSSSHFLYDLTSAPVLSIHSTPLSGGIAIGAP
jgi:hypothetical protein